jgi:lipopolysaccharide transport system ATP-binding protein
LSDFVIRVEGLGKSYRLRHERYVALRDVIADQFHSLGRRLLGRGGAPGADDEEEFWALREVGFEVKRGEVLGIIGRNGAGKSTLLKVLSRITEPTEGRVRINGRVASLLEVGTGFHPELTGRENIYLNGAILGMTRDEIRRKFDEIVVFAEVEKFLDTPVKRFSSGMYVRLAFAVAAHLEPEILVVDEVLSVGDIEFQQRCLGKMREVATASGRTVLFVSHNMGAIQALCPLTLRLESGRVKGFGETREQVENYLTDMSDAHVAGAFARRKLSRSIALEDLQVSPNPIQTGQDARFRLKISSTEPARARDVCLLVYSPLYGRVAILDLRAQTEGYRFGP